MSDINTDTKNTDTKYDITCPCGNNTFKMAEHISGPFRSLYVECTKCGNAISHGGGLYVRDVIFAMKDIWHNDKYKEIKKM